MICGMSCELARCVHTGLSWTPSLQSTAEAKPNLSQLYLSRLGLAKPANLDFFKTRASDQHRPELLNRLSKVNTTAALPSRSSVLSAEMQKGGLPYL